MILGGAALVGFDAVREFAKHIGGKLGDDVGEWARALSTYRLNNITAKLQRAHRMIEEAGRTPNAVPPRTLLPWLEHASIEDDESLSERWAAILANAATADSEEDAPPIYSSILAELTPFAARVLDALRDTQPMRGADRGSLRAPGGVTAAALVRELDQSASPASQFGSSPQAQYRAAEAKVNAAIDVLIRQGLASRTPTIDYQRSSGFRSSSRLSKIAGRDDRPIEMKGTEIRITELGRRFLLACTPPSPATSAGPAARAGATQNETAPKDESGS